VGDSLLYGRNLGRKIDAQPVYSVPGNAVRVWNGEGRVRLFGKAQVENTMVNHRKSLSGFISAGRSIGKKVQNGEMVIDKGVSGHLSILVGDEFYSRGQGGLAVNFRIPDKDRLLLLQGKSRDDLLEGFGVGLGILDVLGRDHQFEIRLQTKLFHDVLHRIGPVRADRPNHPSLFEGIQSWHNIGFQLQVGNGFPGIDPGEQALGPGFQIPAASKKEMEGLMDGMGMSEP